MNPSRRKIIQILKFVTKRDNLTEEIHFHIPLNSKALEKIADTLQIPKGYGLWSSKAFRSKYYEVLGNGLFTYFAIERNYLCLGAPVEAWEEKKEKVLYQLELILELLDELTRFMEEQKIGRIKSF